MKQWNGLLKKEWATMSGQFYGTLGASILFTLLIPFGSSLFNWGLDALEVSLILSLVWMAASLLIPTIMLLISLGKEMNRTDIWLHSTSSIFKLFGSKAVFSGFVGFVNMVIPTLVIIIESRFFVYLMDFSFKTILEIGVIMFFMFYMISLLVMCIGLFFGVLYQLMKPVAKGFAIPNVVILFLFSSWLAERISSTAAYKKIVNIGPIKGPGEKVFNIDGENFLFEIDTTPLYMGDILLNFVFGALLFITAVVLFEKKVRI